MADTSAIDYETATKLHDHRHGDQRRRLDLGHHVHRDDHGRRRVRRGRRLRHRLDANTLAEDVSNGASAEITASATDADGTTNTVTYAITAQSCSGAFAIDSGSGAITVADTSVIDYESRSNKLHYLCESDQRRRIYLGHNVHCNYHGH